MKIIYVENARIPSERAHAYQTVQWCHWMGALGHEVILVTPDRAEGKDVFAFYQLKERTFTHVVLPTVDALRYTWLPQRLAYLIQRWTFTRSLRAWAASKQADYWYTRSPAMIDALRGIVSDPWVLEGHDDPTRNNRRWQRTRPLIAFFVAISDGLKQHLLTCGVKDEMVLVAHDGVDMQAVTEVAKQDWRKTLGLPSEAFVALYTGGLYPWKGVDFVVKAWQYTPSSAHLVIAGGPTPDRERLTALVPAAARERIHILPMMPREQVFSLLHEGDLGLIPTSPNFAIGREFTSPLKLFEYLAAGLPILASEVPSSHEILDTSMARFFSQDPQDFANKVVEIMQDLAWRQTASSRAKEVVKRYSWEERAKRVEERMKSELIHLSNRKRV